MRPYTRIAIDRLSKKEADDLCTDVLVLVTNIAEEVKKESYPPVSKYCPPELRYDYEGNSFRPGE